MKQRVLTPVICLNQGRIADTTAADGQITSYEYDSLGRQVATLGHPQQASTVGLIVQGVPLVRLRSETVFGDDGRVQQQITNIRQYVGVALAVSVLDRSAQHVTSYEDGQIKGAGLIVSHQRVLPPDPPYIGALPPGPAPPEGDWFTRLQVR